MIATGGITANGATEVEGTKGGANRA